MSLGKLLCIAENVNLSIYEGFVLFPDGNSIPINKQAILINKLINLFNEVKATKIVWEQCAHIIGFDVGEFMKCRIPIWRCGKSVGRTIYHNGQLCGMMDTPELAVKVVDALNRDES